MTDLKTLNIDIPRRTQATDWLIEFEFIGDDGLPLDFTGAEIQMRFKDDKSDAVRLTRSIGQGITVAAGLVIVTATPSETNFSGTLKYDLRVKQGGVQTVFIAGNMTVRETQTTILP
jgi:hypothetical protein